MPPPYQAIFWDNDGVLVDTERLYFQATREAMAEAGLDLSPRLYFDYFLASARGTVELARERGVSLERAEQIRTERNRRYQQLLATAPIAIPGVRETLAALHGHFLMAIVTSAQRQHFETIHRRTGLLGYFSFFLAEGDYAASKPAPDPYLAALARTGIPPERCVAIEDTPRGLASAKAAGIDCWVVATELSCFGDFAAADRVLGSVTEVAAALRTTPENKP